MIELLAVLTLVLVLAIVLIVAYHLIGIFLALRKGAGHLEKLAGGLVKIRADTAPLNDKVVTVNGGLSALAPPLLGANSNLAAIVTIATSG